MSDQPPPFVPPQGDATPTQSAPPVPPVPTPPVPLQPQGLPEPSRMPYAAGPGATPTTPGTAGTPGTSGTSAGAVANPLSGTVQRPWRASNSAWSLAVIGLLVCNIVLHGFNAMNDLSLINLIDAGEFDELLRVANGSDGLIGVSLVLIVATGIVFLIWLHRIWTSDRSDPMQYSRGTGLAIGGWFIPFASLALGPLSVRDLWRGVTSARARLTGTDAPPARTPGLLIAWWVAWVAANLASTVSRVQARSLNEVTSFDAALSGLKSALSTEALGSLMMIAAAVLMIVIVRKIMACTAR